MLHTDICNFSVDLKGEAVNEKVKLKDETDLCVNSIGDITKHLPYLSNDLTSAENQNVLILSRPAVESVQKVSVTWLTHAVCVHISLVDELFIADFNICEQLR